MKPVKLTNGRRFEFKEDKVSPIKLTKIRALNSTFVLADLFEHGKHREIVIVRD